jgi:hypothetical protein
MNLFSELQVAVQDDLTIGNESTLFPVSVIQRAINRAYNKCAGLFRWPETEDAKVTTSQLSVDYYDYPQTWRPDTIWKLTLNGVDLGDPLDFKDYQYEVENDLPSGKTTIWSSQWRRYFINPAPTAAGLEIVVWGQRSVEDMTEDEDITIWSYSMPECNEALVLEAVAILKGKGEDDKSGQFRSAEAKQILVVAWNKVKQEQDKYKKTRSEFVIPDFYSN